MATLALDNASLWANLLASRWCRIRSPTLRRRSRGSERGIRGSLGVGIELVHGLEVFAKDANIAFAFDSDVVHLDSEKEFEACDRAYIARFRAGSMERPEVTRTRSPAAMLVMAAGAWIMAARASVNSVRSESAILVNQ